jgi:hypothetical protein
VTEEAKAAPQGETAPALPAPYPAGAYPARGAGMAPVPPPADERWRASSVEPVPGTAFGLVRLEVPPLRSGFAIGGLVAGISGVLASTLVLCFGLTGAQGGWGLIVAGAFAILAGAISLAGLGLGLGARRQIRRSGATGRIRFTGRGVAIAAISCGAAGLALTLLSLALALVVQIA